MSKFSRENLLVLEYFLSPKESKILDHRDYYSLVRANLNESSFSRRYSNLSFVSLAFKIPSCVKKERSPSERKQEKNWISRNDASKKTGSENPNSRGEFQFALSRVSEANTLPDRSGARWMKRIEERTRNKFGRELSACVRRKPRVISPRRRRRRRRHRLPKKNRRRRGSSANLFRWNIRDTRDRNGWQARLVSVPRGSWSKLATSSEIARRHFDALPLGFPFPLGNVRWAKSPFLSSRPTRNNLTTIRLWLASWNPPTTKELFSKIFSAVGDDAWWNLVTDGSIFGAIDVRNWSRGCSKIGQNVKIEIED